MTTVEELAQKSQVIVPETSASKTRGFCLTLWNDEIKAKIEATNPVYLCYAKEVCPSSGKEHWQMYVYYKNERSIKSMGKLVGGEGRVFYANGTAEQNRTYIFGPYSKNGKEKPANPTAVEVGEMPRQGKRNDIIAAGESIIKAKRMRIAEEDRANWDVIARYPKFCAQLLNREWQKAAEELYLSGFAPEVHVFWSRAGGTGKSRKVYEMHHVSEICRGNISSKTGKVWWSSYDGQLIFLLEEFEGQMEYTLWKQLTDRYPIELEIKGGFVWCVRRKLFFTSNKHPDEWWKLDAIEKTQLDRRITSITEVA